MLNWLNLYFFFVFQYLKQIDFVLIELILFVSYLKVFGLFKVLQHVSDCTALAELFGNLGFSISVIS